MRGAALLFVLFKFSCIHIISATVYKCDPTVSCGCSASSTTVTSRIVGGETASDDTWGWMLSLRRNGNHICGATLLTSEYAVTAAHCVEAVLNNSLELSILAGTIYLYDTSNTTVQRRTVTKIIIHPNYNSKSITYDIALLKFSPLTISSDSKLEFLCLPAANQDPFQTNSNLVAIGWGVTSYNSKTASDTLRQVTVQVFSSTSSDCLQSGLHDSNVQFCAGVPAGGKDTCQGDSGGPLMAFTDNRWVLGGITSSGYECAQSGFPGIYTRVSAFISFIQSNVDVSSLKVTGVENYSQSNYKKSITDKLIFILMLSFSSFMLLSFSC